MEQVKKTRDDQLSKKALEAAVTAYFGVITEDSFWKKSFPSKRHIFSKPLPFEDGAALHHTAIDLIMGCEEKSIASPVSIDDLKERLGIVFQKASLDHEWVSKSLSRIVAREAANEAINCASKADKIDVSLSR